ncbi:hypothetical protein OSK38_26900, partial [Escherichia coli]|nr:hypothetical protein [Escherichia coli]
AVKVVNREFQLNQESEVSLDGNLVIGSNEKNKVLKQKSYDALYEQLKEQLKPIQIKQDEKEMPEKKAEAFEIER